MSRPNSALGEENGQVFLAVTGDRQNTAGYSFNLEKVETNESGARVIVKLVPPADGAMVARVLTQPVAYHRLENLNGQVSVLITPLRRSAERLDAGSVLLTPETVQGSAPAGRGAGEGSGEVTLQKAEWTDMDTFYVEGTSSLPDVHIVLKAGNKPLGQADATVKGGRFTANVSIHKGKKMDLELNVVDPRDNKVILVRPLLNETR